MKTEIIDKKIANLYSYIEFLNICFNKNYEFFLSNTSDLKNLELMQNNLNLIIENHKILKHLYDLKEEIVHNE